MQFRIHHVIGIALLLTVYHAVSPAQVAGSLPEDRLTQSELSAHIRFLASDELLGRKTGSHELNIAARYLAEQFRSYGVVPAPSMTDYFQDVPLERHTPPAQGMLVLGRDTLHQGKDVMFLRGDAADVRAEVEYIALATAEDIKTRNVRGKIVVARFQNQVTALARWRAATAEGAVGFVELFGTGISWRALQQYLRRPSIRLASEGDVPSSLPYALVDDRGGRLDSLVTRSGKITALLRSAGVQRSPIRSRNVLGLIPGTDPKLRDEYILVMAHYDHEGAHGGGGSTQTDTIYNGARDNAMGTSALLAAAKSLALQRPARSVLVAAVTAEEEGLLGSTYLSNHFPVRLRQLVYVHNSDGAGYNDTSLVTVIGLERTTAEPALKTSAERYGMKAGADPAPEQNLFDRSDNVTFARKGVPAPTYSPGFTSFDAEMGKYYHRPADQADEQFDFAYFTRFCKAFAHAARLIADMKERPRWRVGDAYEKAAKELYGE